MGSVSFYPSNEWKLFKNDELVFGYKDFTPYILESNQIITDFEISYRTIFGNKIESMKSISTCIKELANVKKGTILVISNTAEKLIDNYADLCIKIEPTILSSANIKKLSSLCPCLAKAMKCVTIIQ